MSQITENLGLEAPEDEDVYDIDYVHKNNTILDNLFDSGTIEYAFYSIFSGIESNESNNTALSATDIVKAINTEYNGETSADPTAMSSHDVEEAVNTTWNGETSPDENALSSGDIENITNS